jgi:hypothetical protein
LIVLKTAMQADFTYSDILTALSLAAIILNSFVVTFQSQFDAESTKKESTNWEAVPFFHLFVKTRFQGQKQGVCQTITSGTRFRRK